MNKPYSYIHLEPADNGYLLRWTEKTKRPGAGTYDDCMHQEHELVFTDAEGDAAFTKFKELHMANKAATGESTQKIVVEVKKG